MNYVLFTVKGKDYKLVLTTRTMVELEKRLNGRNPISILMDVADDKLPTITEMILILWCSMVKYNHGISLDDCYDIFDDYVAEGHAYTDFIEVMMKIFETSGLINTKSTEDSDPNAEMGV